MEYSFLSCSSRNLNLNETHGKVLKPHDRKQCITAHQRTYHRTLEFFSFLPIFCFLLFLHKQSHERDFYFYKNTTLNIFLAKFSKFFLKSDMNKNLTTTYTFHVFIFLCGNYRLTVVETLFETIVFFFYLLYDILFLRCLNFSLENDEFCHIIGILLDIHWASIISYYPTTSDLSSFFSKKMTSIKNILGLLSLLLLRLLKLVSFQYHSPIVKLVSLHRIIEYIFARGLGGQYHYAAKGIFHIFIAYSV